MTSKILLFGYGNHGESIAKSLKEDGFDIDVVVSDEKNQKKAQKYGFTDVFLVDITDDDAINTLSIELYSKVICMMDDEHLNVFLTLSLRSMFKDTFIISISDSIYATQKLKMAGANKVIDLYEVSANRVHNILTRPVATRLLEGFLSNEEGIGFREILIPVNSCLDGKNTDEIDISKYNVLLVGMVDEELGDNFIFITAGINHKLDSGDTIVCLGSIESLDKFTQIISNDKVVD